MSFSTFPFDGSFGEVFWCLSILNAFTMRRSYYVAPESTLRNSDSRLVL